jgi:hypothetical protein
MRDTDAYQSFGLEVALRVENQSRTEGDDLDAARHHDKVERYFIAYVILLEELASVVARIRELSSCFHNEH